MDDSWSDFESWCVYMGFVHVPSAELSELIDG